MTVPFFAGPLDLCIHWNWIWPGIRFFSVFGEVNRDLRLMSTDDDVWNPIARGRAEVGVQMELRTDAFDVPRGIWIHRRMRDVLVE
jgi:hypothetical protein